jgi:hypothetical protein
MITVAAIVAVQSWADVNLINIDAVVNALKTDVEALAGVTVHPRAGSTSSKGV